MNYSFNYDGKEFNLNEDNCEGIFFNDEIIDGFDLNLTLELLNKSNEIKFSKEYYTGKCSCNTQEPLNKSYCYLEYHFFIYSKNNKYVISTISSEYENTSFNKLFSISKIDNSYIVNITVCPNCGTYSVEIEQCEV